MSAQKKMIVFIFIAVIIDYLPIINMPFIWSETFFHEISHGLAALLTGGNIQGITLNFNGSGVCTTRGGTRFLVAFSGYAGSALWGLMIYRAADVLPRAWLKLVVGSLVAILGLTLILWARDVSTISILLVLIVIYIMPLYASLWLSVRSFIQLLGIFVVLDAIRSPLYLLDGRDRGDGATMAELTMLPEIVWVVLWVLMAAASLYILWQLSSKAK